MVRAQERREIRGGRRGTPLTVPMVSVDVKQQSSGAV